MHLSLDGFCEVVKKSNRSNAEKALAVLWYFDHEQSDIAKTAGQLTKVLGDHHIGTPNQTALAEAIRKTKLANESRSGFSLKPGSRKIIRDWLPDLDGIQPVIDHASGYLPEPMWKNTRGYIEAVCRELNGSFHHAYYNAAAVMLRRLLETLISKPMSILTARPRSRTAAATILCSVTLPSVYAVRKGIKASISGAIQRKR